MNHLIQLIIGPLINLQAVPQVPQGYFIRKDIINSSTIGFECTIGHMRELLESRTPSTPEVRYPGRIKRLSKVCHYPPGLR